MNIKQTAVAIFAAASVMTGTVAATATPAEAGYKIKIKHHHGFYGHKFYKPWKFHHYCTFKYKKVWTYHGPVWVKKKVCF